MKIEREGVTKADLVGFAHRAEELRDVLESLLLPRCVGCGIRVGVHDDACAHCANVFGLEVKP